APVPPLLHSFPTRRSSDLLGAQVRIDTHGEVLARGNVVMAGYWAQPEATAEAIRGGWLYTGDGGVLDAEGYLAIQDRKKDVIISDRKSTRLNSSHLVISYA